MNLTKPLTTAALIIVALGVVFYFLHLSILDLLDVELPYNLLNFYLFGAISSLIICLTFITLPELLPELRDKLGFMFLFSIFAKLFLLALIFKNLLFSDAIFTRMERLSMLIPIFIFLIYEVLVIVKILKKHS
ncbi:DUF6168 family protein [Leeuwenhoekiella marinoflava]|uniref:Uncharacterized protein n=2 Tax=Leeuwenhoekiella marinoflava TaxID=988 RepID=A0A4Q0PQT3_9FLAO|nr:DUF6168 family protein [Leeuwenhoekiella marinoflava]RXG32936.1 hypothetical protein DSL99_27 [Leeuwenhoekiella marinoflava]SHE32569.1 hypothetical protein SAMN02745246_00086 [Leeuwenhoekiella marinoflava DSM 3653]